jgi:hypothetical protein
MKGCAIGSSAKTWDDSNAKKASAKRRRIGFSFGMLMRHLTADNSNNTDARNLPTRYEEQMCRHCRIHLIFDLSCKSLQIQSILRFGEVFKNSACGKLPYSVR